MQSSSPVEFLRKAFGEILIQFSYWNGQCRQKCFWNISGKTSRSRRRDALEISLPWIFSNCIFSWRLAAHFHFGAMRFKRIYTDNLRLNIKLRQSVHPNRWAFDRARFQQDGTQFIQTGLWRNITSVRFISSFLPGRRGFESSINHFPTLRTGFFMIKNDRTIIMIKQLSRYSKKVAACPDCYTKFLNIYFDYVIDLDR